MKLFYLIRVLDKNHTFSTITYKLAFFRSKFHLKDCLEVGQNAILPGVDVMASQCSNPCDEH